MTCGLGCGRINIKFNVCNLFLCFCRVDHYLGKQTIQKILSFREKNPAINHLFSQHYVEKIEIVMKEKLSVKGGLKYWPKIVSKFFVSVKLLNGT